MFSGPYIYALWQHHIYWYAVVKLLMSNLCVTFTHFKFMYWYVNASCTDLCQFVILSLGHIFVDGPDVWHKVEALQGVKDVRMLGCQI